MEGQTNEEPKSLCDKWKCNLLRTWQVAIKNATVEPVLFIVWFTAGIAMGSGALQQLDLWRACVVGMGYNDTVCDNLTDDLFEEHETKVQKFLNNLEISLGVASSIPGIIMAVFAGSLSDRYGRKFLLIYPLIGDIYGLCLLAINYTFRRTIPLEFRFLNVLKKFFGGGIFFYMGLYRSRRSSNQLFCNPCVLTDVTAPEDRAFRMTIVQIVDFSSYTLGSMVSVLFFRTFDYVGIIIMRGVGLIFSLLYVILYLKETRVFEEKTEDKSETIPTCWGKTKQMLEKFLWIPMRDFYCCLVAKRRGSMQAFLYLELALYVVYYFSNMRHYQLFLYFQKAFPEEFSLEMYNANNIATRLFIVANLIIVMPILLKKLRLNETTVALVNCCCCTVSMVLQAFARNIFPEFILASSLTLMNYSQWSMIRTTVSKTITKDEVGKVYAMMTLLGSIAPMICGAVVKKVYNATVDTFPSAFILMDSGFYAIATLINLVLFLARKEIDNDEEKKSDDAEMEHQANEEST